MENHMFNYNHKNKKFILYIYIYNELIDVI